MSSPDLAPRRSLGGVIAVWIVAAVAALAVGAFAPEDWRAAWMPVAMGVSIIVAFAVQLATGSPRGFLQRMAASVLGALVVMGFIGIGLGLATLFTD